MATPITIKDWTTGIAQSPYTGFADMRNVDINDEEGVVQIGWNATLVSGTAITGRIKWFAVEERNTGASVPRVFAIDESGVLYQSTDGAETWSSFSDRTGFGEGMEVWKNYLLWTTNTGVGAYGPLSGSAIISSSFQTFSQGSVDWHPITKGQDDILYFGDERYVASLQEVSGTTFSPGTATTQTWNSQALDLSQDYRIKTMAELGKNIHIGTFKGSVSQFRYNNIADIFPWDRVSDSFDLPIRLARAGVHSILNDGNVSYFVAGTKGEVFATNGSVVQPLFRIPDHIVGTTWIDMNPQSLMVHRDKLHLAIMSPGSSGQELTDGVGVWSWNMKNGALVFENQISTGSTGGTAPDTVRVSALKQIDADSYLIAWEDGTDYGIDKVTRNRRYTNYAARIDSPFFSVGSHNKPEVFTELYFELSEPLKTGEGIRFSYRTDINASFTQTSPYTFDFTTHGAIQTGLATLQVESTSGIQVRIEMTTGANSSTSPKLKSVTLR